MKKEKCGGDPKLGSAAGQDILPLAAQERAIAVIADPQVLKTIGAAASLLAWVNAACGDIECRFL